jgi:predicted alpha/beta-hydrolase family hydrolase
MRALLKAVCAIMLAAVIALVWIQQKTRHDESPQRDIQPTYSAFSYIAPARGPAWDKGYEHGYKFGRVTALSRKPVPSAESLRDAALQTAADLGVSDREEFAKGFSAGFAQGYKGLPRTTES